VRSCGLGEGLSDMGGERERKKAALVTRADGEVGPEPGVSMVGTGIRDGKR